MGAGADRDRLVAAQDVERDYYRVEWDDGTQAWIYRDDAGKLVSAWFL